MILPDTLARLAAMLAPSLVDEEREDTRELSPTLADEVDDDGAHEMLDGTGDLAIEDWRAAAAKTKYASGKVKLTHRKRVTLASRRVVMALHQTGAERADSSKRWHYTTAHFVITPAGRVLRLFDNDVYLVCSNMWDVAPYHGIGVEFAGNFEGVDGTGNWYRPDVFGRGRASDAQLLAGRMLARHLHRTVGLHAIAPHRPAAKVGSRPLCCGSRIWSEVGIPIARELGLRVPPDRPLWRGCDVIPPSWHGPHWHGGEGIARV